MNSRKLVSGGLKFSYTLYERSLQFFKEIIFQPFMFCIKVFKSSSERTKELEKNSFAVFFFFWKSTSVVKYHFYVSKS